MTVHKDLIIISASCGKNLELSKKFKEKSDELKLNSEILNLIGKLRINIFSAFPIHSSMVGPRFDRPLGSRRRRRRCVPRRNVYTVYNIYRGIYTARPRAPKRGGPKTGAAQEGQKRPGAGPGGPKRRGTATERPNQLRTASVPGSGQGATG